MDSSTSDTTKCTCESLESDCSSSESPTSTNKEKKKLSLTSLGFSLRRGRSLQFKTKRTKKSSQVSPDASTSSTTTKKSPKWPLKFNCAKREPKNVAPPLDPPTCCQCMCYRRTEEHHLGAGVVFDTEDKASESEENQSLVPLDNMPGVWLLDEPNDPPVVQQEPQPIIREVPISANSIYGQNRTAPLLVRNWDVNWVQTIHEDCDEAARRQRAKEMEEGVAAPANFKSTRRVQLLCSDIDNAEDGSQTRRLQIVCPSDFSVESIRALLQDHVMLRSCPLKVVPECHTQIDFIHCLVPDLLSITNCSYYWGKMDRYEAERLLDGKQDGTFLLRDSAQEEFLFSVSFRKYDRSLHARIEQWNHSFSFDSHDPCVYTSDTICGLIEHYKDPSSCMFFEPVLTWPLHRKSVFSLQHLCRAVIASRMTYDNINKLQLPKVLKSYLKEYHYRQKVHVERFDDDVQ